MASPSQTMPAWSAPAKLPSALMLTPSSVTVAFAAIEIFTLWPSVPDTVNPSGITVSSVTVERSMPFGQ